jgi:hypothetical protein
MSKLVFKIMKPRASFHGVDYNEKKRQKGQASLIHMQEFGHLQDGRTQLLRQDMKKYLSYYSQRNTRIKSPQFHAILSCKGQSFSVDQLKDHALQLMQQMGYGNNPLLIYAHTDTKNNHIHIVSTRIGPDGRKIPDTYEGLKANRILSEMLQLDTQQDCEKAIKEALAYKFSSVAQFKLLMERKGYECWQQLHQISLYKHGTKQRSLPLSVLNGRMEANHILPGELSRIRALIFKYKGIYDPALQKKVNGYPKKSNNLSSPMTKFLHQRFGLEFVFFTGKKHDKPYGYAIIDHIHKTIYKGGDVINIGQLTGLSDNQKLLLPINNENQRSKGRDYDRVNRPDQDILNPKYMVNRLDHLIQNLEYQVEQDLKQEGSNSKKKKKSDQWQKR